MRDLKPASHRGAESAMASARTPGKRTLTESMQPVGAPLRSDVRARFEGSLGADLSAVRVHTGDASAASARAVGARAYAHGDDIHFGAGQYQPDDPAGMHLLAHEVAHTQQQAGAAPEPQYQLEVSGAGDAGELDADRAADAMVAGAPAVVRGGGPARIARAPEAAPGGAAPALWVPFDTTGNWDAATVLRNVSALASVPGDLAAAIQAGPRAAGTLCLQLRARVDAAGADPARRAECDRISNALTSRATELFYGTPQSPLRYAQLAEVAQWDTQFAAAPATMPAAPAPADPASTPAADPAAAELTPGQRYRQGMVDSMHAHEGAVEGTDAFDSILSPSSVKTARLDAGRIGRTFTTCNSFSGVVLQEAQRRSGAKPQAEVSLNVWFPEWRAKNMPAGSWIDAPAPGQEAPRPRPGDIIVFGYTDGTGFSHMANQSEPVTRSADGTYEIWTSIDGGQGQAAVYDAKTDTVSGGKEKIAKVERHYHVDTGIITWANGAFPRIVKGWIDTEKLVDGAKAGTPPGGATK